MSSEFYGIVTVEAFKELGEGVGTMRPKEENVVLIDSLHYVRICSTYLSFQQKLFDAMCIIFNA